MTAKKANETGTSTWSQSSSKACQQNKHTESLHYGRTAC